MRSLLHPQRQLRSQRPFRILSFNIAKGYHNDLYKYVDWTVAGTLKNEGTTMATRTEVMAAIRDAKGVVIGVSSFSIDDEQPNDLSPDTEAAFSLKVTLPDSVTATSVTLFAESNESTIIMQ